MSIHGERQQRSTRLTLRIGLLAMGVAAVPTSHAGVIFVNAAATGANNGTSWTDAHASLTAALAAAGMGDQVWVAAATYKPAAPGGPRTAAFQLTDGDAVYGGFAGTETQLSQRDPAVNVTVLSGDLNGDDGPNFTNTGDNSFHVVNGMASPTTSLIVDGFTIRDGNANGLFMLDSRGGGLLSRMQAAISVRNCRFLDNAATDGGAVYITSETLPAALTACIFIGNAATAFGGAVNCPLTNTPNVRVTNCLFLGNTCVGAGGGVIGAADVTNCVFSGNSTTNDQTLGGGMFGSGNIVNCTFANNTVFGALSGGGGFGRSNFAGAQVTAIRNCVFFGNMAASDPQLSIDPSALYSVEYSCVEGGFAGASNIAADPLFVDADGPDNAVGTADDNVRLGAGSACIDAADSAAVPADLADLDGDTDIAEPTPFDLDDTSRLVDDPTMADTGAGSPPIVDMGAYERSDCNINGIDDGEDIATGTLQDTNPPDGIPDGCTFANPGAGQWSEPTTWTQQIVPNNMGLTVFLVTIAGANTSVTLNIAAMINGLAVLGGAGLLATAGDLIVTTSTGILVAGSLAIGNGSVIDSAGPLTIGDGGAYAPAGTPDGSLAATGLNVHCGGSVLLAGTMLAQIGGDVTLGGGIAVNCLQEGGTTPPVFDVQVMATVQVSGDFRILGCAEVTYGSSELLGLTGDFDNQSDCPQDFQWSGGILLNGQTEAAQNFEVAGQDLGPVPAGFVNNFAMGSVHVANGAGVTIRDVFNNDGTGQSPCSEALYTSQLVLENGSTLVVDNCRIYVGQLTDEGATINLVGCGDIRPTGDANGDGVIDLVDYCSFGACLTGAAPCSPGVSCSAFDYDTDGDTDLADFAAFQANFGAQ